MVPEISRSRGSSIRSAARGAVTAASLEVCAQIGSFSGWYGYGLGRSRWLLCLAAALWIAVALAPLWNRLFPRPAASLALSLLGLAGLAFLVRAPWIARLTGTIWIDATLVFLLPAVPWSAHAERRSSSLGLAALGAAAAIAIDETVLVPRVGFGLSLAIWALAWAGAELATWERPGEDLPASTFARMIARLGWGGLGGLAIVVARPFLGQHLPIERAGSAVLATSVLLAIGAGFLASSGLSRSFSRRWVTATGLVFFALGGFAAWKCLAIVTWNQWPAWVEALRGDVPSLPRTVMATWLFIAVPALSWGVVLRGLGARGARAVAVAALGVWAGTALGEGIVLPALDGGGAWESAARSRLRHPPLVPVNAHALNPDGVLSQYPANNPDGPTSMLAWRSIPWVRPRTWSRLEACEILAPRSSLRSGPAGSGAFSSELTCIGSPQPGHAGGIPEREPSSPRFLDPLPSLEGGEERGRNPCELAAGGPIPADAVVILSHPLPCQGLFLAETGPALARTASAIRPGGVLWVWCDPRTLQAEGVGTTLATWRATFPSGSVYLLFDGYAGPLLGLRAQGPEPDDAELAQAILWTLPAKDLDVAGLPPATPDRPLLDWQCESGPPAFDLASGSCLRALARSFGLRPEGAPGHLLEGLARHADAQERRQHPTPAEDRIRITEDELEAYLDALRSDPKFAPTIRHLAFAAGLLQRKRDYDVLLTLMRSASALRPDVGAFHRYLGLALGELLDRDGALAELELAYSLSPESLDVRAELSKLYADAGRLRDAQRLLESVWQERPTVEIAKGLGLTYLELEDFPKARQFLEFAHARSPLDVDVERGLKRLEQR